MSDDLPKYFVYSFIEYLKSQIEIEASADVVESLEVAIQCLEAAYELDQTTFSDDSNTASSGGGGLSEEGSSGSATGGGEKINRLLLSNINLFELFQSAFLEKNPEKQAEAEEVKNEGNRLMKEGKFYEALLQYNKAIRLDPRNPIFYCNRAAAYTRLNEFSKAITDCKISLSYNPDYGKAYGRLGVAYSNLQKIDEAREAYKRAIALEPDNNDYKNNLRLLDKKQNNSQNILGEFANPAISDMLINVLNDPNFLPLFRAMTSGDTDVLNRFRDTIEQLETENPNLVDFRQQIANTLQNAVTFDEPQNMGGGTFFAGAPASSQPELSGNVRDNINASNQSSSDNTMTGRDYQSKKSTDGNGGGNPSMN